MCIVRYFVWLLLHSEVLNDPNDVLIDQNCLSPSWHWIQIMKIYEWLHVHSFIREQGLQFDCKYLLIRESQKVAGASFGRIKTDLVAVLFLWDGNHLALFTSFHGWKSSWTPYPPVEIQQPVFEACLVAECVSVYLCSDIQSEIVFGFWKNTAFVIKFVIWDDWKANKSAYHHPHHNPFDCVSVLFSVISGFMYTWFSFVTVNPFLLSLSLLFWWCAIWITLEP